MATEYALERTDREPMGPFSQVQAAIREVFPNTRFFWTTSGKEKLRLAAERGVEIPPLIKEGLETLPSLMEGVCEGEQFHVTFGLGHSEPVRCLYLTPRGEPEVLLALLEELERTLGGVMVVSREETNRLQR